MLNLGSLLFHLFIFNAEADGEAAFVDEDVKELEMWPRLEHEGFVNTRRLGFLFPGLLLLGLPSRHVFRCGAPEALDTRALTQHFELEVTERVKIVTLATLSPTKQRGSKVIRQHICRTDRTLPGALTSLCFPGPPGN